MHYRGLAYPHSILRKIDYKINNYTVDFENFPLPILSEFIISLLLLVLLVAYQIGNVPDRYEIYIQKI